MKIARLIVEIIGWIVISLIASITVLTALNFDEWSGAEPDYYES